MVDYESPSLLEQYLLFHYGRVEEILPYSFGPKSALHFPQRCVQWGEKFVTRKIRALDLGCAVGGASFELAKYFSEVVGVDYSKQFISVANQLKQKGAINYCYALEGDIKKFTSAKVDSLIDRQRTSFRQGDAENLEEDLGEFDAVIMLNLIDRLKNPKKCLDQISSFIKEEGLLMLASPYTWLETITPKENWLGGFLKNHTSVFTLELVKEILGISFKLIERADFPFLIREHARKFQWNVAEVTLWQKDHGKSRKQKTN